MQTLLTRFALLSTLAIAAVPAMAAVTLPIRHSAICADVAGDDRAGAFATALEAARAGYQQDVASGKIAPVEASPWYASAGFSAGKANVVVPAQNQLDVAAKDAQGKPVWKIHPEWADGNKYSLGLPGNTTICLYRTLTTKVASNLEIFLGSDDGLEVLLNGKSVLVNDASRGVEVDNDHVVLKLQPGKNDLVFKIHNGGGDSGFFYRQNGDTATTVWKALADKFPAETGLIDSATPNAGTKWIADAKPAAAASQLLAAAKVAAERQILSAKLPLVNPDALLRAIEDLEASAPGKLADVAAKRQAVEQLKKDLPEIAKGVQAGKAEAIAQAKAAIALQEAIVFANPAIDFDSILLVKRQNSKLGLPQNWQGNTSIAALGYDNEIGRLSLKDKSYKTVYRPANGGFVGDYDLHFDAGKMVFSGIGSQSRWQVFEANTDGTGLRQVTAGEYNDVDNYDPMYLPDGRIIFTSSATFVGVPCVGGADYVGNSHIMNPDGTGVRRLCFDQDNNWCPTMMKNGRVLYLRWEYTDSAHYFSRVLMHMNPDGTGQLEFYGSNSYWPNGTWYARQLPGNENQFVAVVSGHHGVPRMGELFVFDVSKGRSEDTGVVQQLPGYGKPFKGKIVDGLVNGSWPKFLHPFPISDKQFLVSCCPRPGANWGVYLVDIFDNLTLISEDPKYALFEPVPLKTQPKPPIVPDKIDPKRTDATVFIQDVYEGTGLRNVARGTVKALRIFQYEYSYRNMGGHYAIGVEGPWDIRRLIGTVPVFEDGSTIFKIPANVPLAIQPLDANGCAMQQMRSWMTAMPGENIQCVGCHERRNQTILPKRTKATNHAPMEITPWHGPKRGFSFLREVQPVLNRNCTACHNGADAKIPNFKDTAMVDPGGMQSTFPASYLAIHPYVRRNGPEGDYHILTPLEFHANTSELVQMLQKGHHGVKLDAESWDRLYTWIDLNVPCHGTWTESGRGRVPGNFVQRRDEMRKKYAGIEENIEGIVNGDKYDETPTMPKEETETAAAVKTAGWPFTADEAKKRQAELGATTMEVDLGNGQKLTFVKVPAGKFAMGSATGALDERPMSVVKIDKPFWICTTEISLAQYQAFDPVHKNGYYDQHYKDQVRPGYDMDKPELPVIRVSWNQSMDFCKWLSAKSGKKVSLPTEAQWEYACRAGSDQPMSFGDLAADFGKFANLADIQLKKMAVSGVDPQPISNPNKYWDFIPKITTVDDGTLHLASITKYEPNAWGIKNMHGNVAEWCLDTFRAYPYEAKSADAKEATTDTQKVVRGGSWRDRPYRATSSFRLAFPAWQQPYNVGIRPIIVEK